MSIPPFGTSAEPATIDRIYSALATETGRAVLAYFDASSTQTASVDDLTEYIVTRQSADSRTRKQVQLHLYHVRLPKLQDAGFIDYDARTATVRYPERSTSEEWDALVAEILKKEKR